MKRYRLEAFWTALQHQAAGQQTLSDRLVMADSCLLHRNNSESEWQMPSLAESNGRRRIGRPFGRLPKAAYLGDALMHHFDYYFFWMLAKAVGFTDPLFVTLNRQ